MDTKGILLIVASLGVLYVLYKIGLFNSLTGAFGGGGGGGEGLLNPNPKIIPLTIRETNGREASIAAYGPEGVKSSAAMEAALLRPLSSTTPGYHPLAQSEAYEAAYTSGRMISPGIPIEVSNIQPVTNVAQKATIKSAYEQYAASRAAG